MMHSDEVGDIVKACSEFAEKECDKDMLKAWKKGFELGYFNLEDLSATEASAVFEGIFSVKPTFGVPMLYFTISQHIFGEFASLAIHQERLITDFTYDKYIKVDNSEASIFFAEEKYYTPELIELRVDRVVDTAESDIRPLLNLLLAARCVGTAKYALKTALGYLREREKAGYEDLNYCHCFEKLGEISAEIEASKLMVYHAASLFKSDNSKPFPEMALWKAACTAVIAADESILLQEGFYSYKEDFKVEIFRYIAELKHRNPKGSSIYDLKNSELYFPFTYRFHTHFPE
ncbi:MULTISPECIES: acyl-CoA dehydrogenase family protein [unclassified Archaeoglobus]|jgi:hypothetical protein|uniref:acyl-CoA dehydrogenase family protein n=2 Tax=Archaeoglobus TaxID=2233 RepID=UPI0025C2DD41|nr:MULTISPECIES: acyl-CoA dehydrogenase family protein [unclassified Archaeoglobus]